MTVVTTKQHIGDTVGTEKQRRYVYQASLKSVVSDELINTYLIRPIAGLIVGALYRTRIRPIQVVIVGTCFGILSAVAYSFGTPALGALLLAVKNLLDAADGQLARAKGLADRRGRFLDSISDFVVNLLVFAAISCSLYHFHSTPVILLLGLLCLLGLTFRVSYFVYYQGSYLRLEDRMKLNRLTEKITDEDRQGDRVALRLQQIYLVIYDWQDTLVYHIDNFCRSMCKALPEPERCHFLRKWYSQKTALRFSSFLGLGTELAVLIAMSLLNRLHLYFLMNLFLLNGYLVCVILYRKFILGNSILKELNAATKS